MAITHSYTDLKSLPPMSPFVQVSVSGTYDASATSITLVTGQGADLPTPATHGDYPLLWWDSDNASAAEDPNAEWVKVTARSTDTLTVERGHGPTSASTKNNSSSNGYVMSRVLGLDEYETIAAALPINVKDVRYGAAGDNSQDDAPAINAAIAAASAGDRVLIPNGTYRCDSKISVGEDIELICLGELLINHAGTGVEFASLGNSDAFKTTASLAVRKATPAHSTAGSVGIEVLDCRYVNLDVRVLENFTTGIRLGSAGTGGDGTFACTVTLREIHSCRRGVHLEEVGSAKCEGNLFLGGRFYLESGAPTGYVSSRTDYRHIHVDGSDDAAGNVFVGPKLEDVGDTSNYAKSIECDGENNQFLGVWHEGATSSAVVFGTTAAENLVQVSVGIDGGMISDSSTDADNMVVFPGHKQFRSEIAANPGVVFETNGSGDDYAHFQREGDANPRLVIEHNSGETQLNFGGGTSAPDIALARNSNGVLECDGKIGGQLAVNNYVGTIPSGLVGKYEVFDETGASLGFVPIYSA